MLKEQHGEAVIAFSTYQKILENRKTAFKLRLSLTYERNAAAIKAKYCKLITSDEEVLSKMEEKRNDVIDSTEAEVSAIVG